MLSRSPTRSTTPPRARGRSWWNEWRGPSACLLLPHPSVSELHCLYPLLALLHHRLEAEGVVALAQDLDALLVLRAVGAGELVLLRERVALGRGDGFRDVPLAVHLEHVNLLRARVPP